MDITLLNVVQRLPIRAWFCGPRYRLNRLVSKCDGSIVVEAAILLPLVMLVFLFFVYLVQAAVIATALQSAVTNTAKQVAAHMYPVALSAGQLQQSDSTGVAGDLLSMTPAQRLRLTVEQFTQSFAEVLPSPAAEWMNSAGEWASDAAQGAGEQAQAALGQVLLSPLLERYGVKQVLDPESIRLTHLKLPDLVEKQEPYIALQAEYDLPMRVPLLMKTITITARASERVWIGDHSSSSRQVGADSSKPAPMIVSIEPDPLVPWGTAKLTAKVQSNEQAKLVVYYKSGTSVAKGLIWKTADADGYVAWEWNVSGNTTEGTWWLQVVTEDNRTADRSFDVEKNKP